MLDQATENRYNYFLFALVFLLLCIGLVMVYSASHHVAYKKLGSDSIYFRFHFYRILIGLFALIIAAIIPYNFWLKSARIWLLIGIGLLIAVLILGIKERNAQRWIEIYSFRFQPVDVLRMALIFYLCDAMIRKHEYLRKWKEGLLPQLFILGLISFLLIKQPDMGSVVILLAISVVIFITAGVSLLHLSFVALLTVPLFLMKHDYHIVRIKDFLDSVINGKSLPYQVNQSIISLGSGGFWGKGLDNSTQKLEFLPEPFTDFIFSIVGEEFGFVGTSVVLFLFLLLILEGFKIARRCPDEAGALLAVGITTSIGIYAFVNAGVVSNLLPTKGLPMPFISYGGSFMITTLAGVGILLNISQYNESSLVRRSSHANTMRRSRRWVGR